MRPKHVSLVLMLSLFCLSGCAATTPGPSVSRFIGETGNLKDSASADEITTAVEAMLDSVYVSVFSARQRNDVYVLETLENERVAKAMKSHVASSLTKILTARASDKRAGEKVLAKTLIEENMRAFGLEATEQDMKRNADVWEDIGVDLLMIPDWSPQTDDLVNLTLEVFDVHRQGQRVFSIVKTVKKDEQIRKLMGEKLPGTLLVYSNDPDATVYLDSRNIGKMGKSGMLLEIPYGSHTVIIEKEGYRDLERSISMPEKGRMELIVKFQAPSAAAFGIFVLNAVLPMSAALICDGKVGKRETGVALNGLSGLLFYGFGISYLSDFLDKHDSAEQYLDKKNYERRKRIMHAELYGTMICYGLNLMTGLIVSSDYQISNRKVIDVTQDFTVCKLGPLRLALRPGDGTQMHDLRSSGGD